MKILLFVLMALICHPFTVQAKTLRVGVDTTVTVFQHEKIKEFRHAAVNCAVDFYNDSGNCVPCPAHAKCDGKDFTCLSGYYKGQTVCTCSGSRNCCVGFVSTVACIACPEHGKCLGGKDENGKDRGLICESGYFRQLNRCDDICSGTTCKDSSYRKTPVGDRCYCDKD